MEGERRRSNLLVHVILTLMVPDLIYSLSYPIFMSKRFGRSGSAHLPVIIQKPEKFAEIQVSDYDYTQPDGYDKYSLYGYPEDQSEEEEKNTDSGYPYGQENWSEGANTDANAAFVQNLILSQMYPEPDEDEFETPYVYGKSVEFSPDDEDEADRTWYYGIPVLEESGEENDESVKELESLRKHMKDEELKVTHSEKLKSEHAPVLKDEVFRNRNVKKQVNLSSRKTKGQFNRFHSPEKSDSKTVLAKHSYHSKEKSEPEPATTAIPRSQPKGQKEYVLPRPASPVRNPVARGISTRSNEKVSVYDTIKKLLAMEQGFRKVDPPRIRKRFVLSEDQLTSQLSGLKKMAV